MKIENKVVEFYPMIMIENHTTQFVKKYFFKIEIMFFTLYQLPNFIMYILL